jgi:hypothetical protein
MTADNVNRKAAKRLTQYEFEQMIAEAVHRVGGGPVEIALSEAGKQFGWPIPAEHQAEVAAGIAIIVQGIEKGGGTGPTG